MATDEQRDRLKSDATLAAEFEAIFRETVYVELLEAQFEKDWVSPRYSDKVRAEMACLKRPGVEIESQQSVDREEGGNWWHRMK